MTGSDRETTYVEWVNDPDSNALAITSILLNSFSGSSPYYQSGIGFFTACSSSFTYQSDNSQRNVYSSENTAITTPTATNVTVNDIILSGAGITNQSDSGAQSPMPTLSTSANSETLALFVTHSVTFGLTGALPGPFGDGNSPYTASVAGAFAHPLKSHVTSSAYELTNFLVFTSSNTSDLNNNEYFTSETYRIQSGTYGSQTVVTSSDNEWRSTSSMNSGADLGHYAGLAVWNNHLITPLSGNLGGDYRSVDEGGDLQAPPDNPNYTSLTIPHRQYERYFKNNTSSDTPQITITLYGDATLVGRSGANSGSIGGDKNIYCGVKIAGKTGYLDLAKPSPGAGSTGDGAGGLSGDLTSAVDADGASNVCTFNGVTLDGTASSPEYVIIRLVADKQFTGKISRIQVAYS